MIGIFLSPNCTHPEDILLFAKVNRFEFSVLFGDDEIADKVLKSDSPRKQKALGRKVNNFDGDSWNKECKSIVKRGNVAKVWLFSDLLSLNFQTFILLRCIYTISRHILNQI